MSSVSMAPITIHAAPMRRSATASSMRARRDEDAARRSARCSACNLRDICLPGGLDEKGMDEFSDMVYTRKRVKRGDTLYRTGEDFNAIYAVHAGFFKSSVVLEDGRDQVTGFHMMGEIVGMDGIGTEHHTTDVIALEDSEVCIIPYARLEEAGLQRQLHKAMSRELVRDQGVMMLLGTMRAEERLAAFLLNLAKRLKARGFSSQALLLRMTRDEIGSLLGMKLETVSRIFSRFQKDGLIKIEGKHVPILSIDGVRAVIGH